MKRFLLLVGALALAAGTLCAQTQTPQYLQANGCSTSSGGNLTCPGTIMATNINVLTGMGVVGAITLTGSGSGYAGSESVAIGGCSGIGATAHIGAVGYKGSITSLVLDTGGSGFLCVPKVVIGPPTVTTLAGGTSPTQATATATLSGLTTRALLSITTQAGLGSASSNNNVVKIISDASGAGSCGAGGGSTPVVCWSNGTSWLPVGGATYPGVTPDGSNGLAITGSVSAAGAVSPFTAPNAAIVTIPVANPNNNGSTCNLIYQGGLLQSSTCAVHPFYWILVSGQSLSVGGNGGAAITKTQPYNNVMLSPGAEGTSLPLIPLTENGTGTAGDAETTDSGMANTLAAMTDPVNLHFGVGLHGLGGTQYSGLAMGSAPFAKGMTQVQAAKAGAAIGGYLFKPIAVVIHHGEYDYNNAYNTISGTCGPPCNSATYEGYLQTWQANYLTSVQAYAAVATLPMFITQMNQGWTGEMAQAQWQAHKDNPGKIILVGPKYQYGYGADHLHMTALSYKQVGELTGKVLKKVLFDVQTWNPLMMSSVSLASNVVTVNFAIPTGTLAIDTTTVAARPNYGFEFTSTNGNGATISSVALINGNTQAQITLSATPTGGAQFLRYAWTCPNGIVAPYWCAEASDGTRVGGNIRDTDTTVSPASNGTGAPLYDWLVAGQLPFPSVPAAPTGVSATPGNAFATVSFAPSVSGYPVTNYTVTSSPSGITASGTASPIVVSSLANGTAYTFTVKATNTYGDSAVSAATSSVTPAFAIPWLDLALGGNYTDSSPNARTVTAAGTGNSFVTDPAGVHGTVLSLNGSGWATMAVGLPKTYTITAWVYLTSTAACLPGGGTCNIVLSSGSPTRTLWVASSTAGGAPATVALKGAGDSYTNYVWDSVAFPTNAWVHVAISYDGTTGNYRLYKSGALTATGSHLDTVTTTWGSPTNIGAYNGGAASTWTGYMCKVRVYAQVLDDASVATVAGQN